MKVIFPAGLKIVDCPTQLIYVFSFAPWQNLDNIYWLRYLILKREAYVAKRQESY